MAEAEQEASQAKVAFTTTAASIWLDFSRRQILDGLNDRLAHFVRCGRDAPDKWADDFRQTSRITLSRALVLLSVPKEEWLEPPQQDYVRNVLSFFTADLSAACSRVVWFA